MLLCAMHHNKSTTGPKQKPEIVDFYNKTKSGVDIMDKLLVRYTTHK